MIPNALKILQLLGSAIKVIFIIMFLLTSVKSESSCLKPVRAYVIYNELAHGYLAVVNGTVGITYKKHTLYIIPVYMNPSDQLDPRKASKFFIFDPSEKQFICLMNKKKHRFVAKKNLKPEELCLFLEEDMSNIYSHFIVEFSPRESYALKFSKNGVLLRPTHKSNKRSQLFLKKTNDSECDKAEDNFCNNLIKGRHRKQSQTIRNLCRRN